MVDNASSNKNQVDIIAVDTNSVLKISNIRSPSSSSLRTNIIYRYIR